MKLYESLTEFLLDWRLYDSDLGDYELNDFLSMREIELLAIFLSDKIKSTYLLV